MTVTLATKGGPTLDGGIAGLVGAAIGGATATIAALIASRATRQQAQAQHRLWRAQTRREVYAAYTEALDAAAEASEIVRMQAAQILVASLRGAASLADAGRELSGTQKVDERQRAKGLVEALKPFSARAALEGPATVREAAQVASSTLRTYLLFCIETVERPDNFTEVQARNFTAELLNECSSSARTARETFFEQVTRVLDGEA